MVARPRRAPGESPRRGRKYDPSTGGCKRAMLNAQFGDRETFPDNLAMNALEKLVPKDLGRHLLLN